VSFCRISTGKPNAVQNGLDADILFRRKNAIVSIDPAHAVGIRHRSDTVIASEAKQSSFLSTQRKRRKKEAGLLRRKRSSQ